MSAPALAVAENGSELEEDGCPKSVLGKAQLLLGAFGAGAFRLKLTELSRRSGVPKASAYRLAQELVQWGLLERAGDSYQLGLRVFELGQRVPIAAVLRAVSRPYLMDLFAVTRATVHLSVLDGRHVLYVEKVAGEANVHTHSEVGGRLPASCTASGKVLLAHHADARATLASLAAAPGLTRLTNRSTATVEDLGRELAEVRRHRYGIELEETLAGYGTVAVPIAGTDGVVYAAVSATLPVHALPVSRLVGQLNAAAQAIGRAVEQRLMGRFATTADLSAIVGGGAIPA